MLHCQISTNMDYVNLNYEQRITNEFKKLKIFIIHYLHITYYL